MEISTMEQLRLFSKARRQELQLTQQTVATRARVSRKWLSEFELGKGGVELAAVLRLLLALEVHLDLVPAGQETGPSHPPADHVDLDALLAGLSTPRPEPDPA